MNDQSRISPCGIYRRRTGTPCADAFVWITLYPTIFYYQYLLRPYVPMRRAHETAAFSLSEKYIAFSSYLLSRKKSLVRTSVHETHLSVSNSIQFSRERERSSSNIYVSLISYLRSLNQLYIYYKRYDEKSIIIKKLDRIRKVQGWFWNYCHLIISYSNIFLLIFYA